ncbi:hypothetical protein CSUI_006514, partial [Cystoisospora suis]
MVIWVRTSETVGDTEGCSHERTPKPARLHKSEVP